MHKYLGHWSVTSYGRALFLLLSAPDSLLRANRPVTAGRKAKGLGNDRDSQAARGGFIPWPVSERRSSLRSHWVLGRTMCGRRSPPGETWGVSLYGRVWFTDPGRKPGVKKTPRGVPTSNQTPKPGPSWSFPSSEPSP